MLQQFFSTLSSLILFYNNIRKTKFEKIKKIMEINKHNTNRRNITLQKKAHDVMKREEIDKIPERISKYLV